MEDEKNPFDADSMMQILKDPRKFGLPTFKDFCKNPDKYKYKLEDMLAAADASTQILKDQLTKQEYVVRGRKCATLTEVTHIAEEEGVDLLNCEICPQLLPSDNDPLKYKICVEFKEKLIWTTDHLEDPSALRGLKIR